MIVKALEDRAIFNIGDGKTGTLIDYGKKMVKAIRKSKASDMDPVKASADEMVGLLKGINIVAKKLGISTEVGKGYRALANISDHGGQEVPHLHFHLFGGERVGKMVE